jgi:hypothetical protein
MATEHRTPNTPMSCPVCGGRTFEVASPGRLRCITEVAVNALPPGEGGNVWPHPIPIYGQCGHVASDADWRATGAMADAEATRRAEHDRLAAERRAQETPRRTALERRHAALFAALRAAGNPGLVRRRVPGRFHRSLFARVFGRPSQEVLVETEPAWLIGSFTWMWIGSHGMENFENIATGVTPDGRFVPMRHGTETDDVHILLKKRTLWQPTVHRYDLGRSPETADIVAALEAVAAKAGVEIPQHN